VIHRAALLLLVAAVSALAACAGGGAAAAKKKKEKAEIHYNLGAEALRQGRAQDALREFDEALAAEPDFPEAHLGRGLVMEFGYGKLEDAERHYRRALELKPSFPEAHNNLGQLLARTSRLGEAVRQFDAALEDMQYREPFIARCNKGEALYRLGKQEEGLAELDACLKLNPRYCLGHRTLGRIQLDDGKTKLAAESFGRYAQHCPAEPDAWYQLGLAQLKAGDAAQASEAFERCEQLAGEGVLAAECKRSRELLQ
jgi:type IV pilus biogenesis/stability protein PilW